MKTKFEAFSSRLLQITLLLILPALLFEACRPKVPTNLEGYVDDYPGRLKNDPDFAKRVKDWEFRVRDFMNDNEAFGVLGIRSTVVTIPVVVHVVHLNTDALGSGTNISDAQIDAQIAQLNADFRANNTELSAPPAAIAAAVSAFGSLAADTRIEFARAVRDPNCLATTGITRTSTTTATFNYNPGAGTGPARNPVKFASSNGHDAWDARRYLNIWVCDLNAALGTGYAAPPADLAARPAEDGVVIDFTQFNSGQRDLTNRVARWLGLLSIYGADPTDCSDDDGVADTPAQGRFTACPAHPQASCTAGIDAMFINFMDDTDDNCKVMFTTGQADLMNATLFTTRNDLLGSAGLVPPPPGAAAGDLWAKDTDADIGNEPNTQSTSFYQSEDIWVRTGNDGATNQEHLNPTGGSTNYVYVRVRNRGCASSAGANVRLYWAKASTGLIWPTPWDGTTSSASGAVLGGQIGPAAGISSGSVASGAERIVEFTWTSTPDPASYTADFGAGNGHFCLLAIIDEPTLNMAGGVGTFTQENNEIVWKNVHVDGASEDDADMQGASLAANFSKEEQPTKFRFETPKGEASIFNWGTVEVQLADPMLTLWQQGGEKGSGIQRNGAVITLLKEGATIDNILLPAGAVHPVRLKFVKKSDAPKMRDVYKLDMQQWALQGNTETQIGGQTFVLKVERDKTPPQGQPGKGEENPWKRWWPALLAAAVILLGWAFRKRLFKQG